MGPHIYLDHNATTPILPEVADAVRETSLRHGANAGSQHDPGRQSRRALEQAREQIGELLGARMTGMTADRVVFTSGGTEAANLAVQGMVPHPLTSSRGGVREDASVDATPHVITTRIEHPCVLEAVARLQHCDVDYLDADLTGRIDPAQLRALLRPTTRLVSAMLANNETGVLQPVEAIAKLCAEHHVPLHTDAAQAVGKVPVNFSDLNVAALSCTAHKFHGPLGVGVLLLRHDVALEPMLRGGHQQAGLRPGTEPVALAVGMATALECWHRSADETTRRLESLRDRFEQSLAAAVPTGGVPSIEVIGRAGPRLPNTSNLSFVGLNRQALLMALDQAGVACSSGSACASGSSEPSPVLVAMGLEKAVIDGSLRFSLGSSTTSAEIDDAVNRISRVCNALRR